MAKIEAELTCSICCSVVSQARATVCGHVFCKQCITRWLRQRRTCPNCQRQIGVADTLVPVPALDNVVDAVVESSPTLSAARASVQRRRDSECLLTFFTLTGRSWSAPRDPTVTAVASTQQSSRAVDLDQIYVRAAQLDLELRRRMETLDEMGVERVPRPASAPVETRPTTARVSLVDRQRINAQSAAVRTHCACETPWQMRTLGRNNQRPLPSTVRRWQA